LRVAADRSSSGHIPNEMILIAIVAMLCGADG
jgi:hypothetical protein